mmetsp:Transcript_52876/g.99073  ORF Transcript_52876/g.99073 Transcript_52876/m.99073 type:complete len:116 (-) Transcript_52876:229-576(-)
MLVRFFHKSLPRVRWTASTFPIVVTPRRSDTSQACVCGTAGTWAVSRAQNIPREEQTCCVKIVVISSAQTPFGNVTGMAIGSSTLNCASTKQITFGVLETCSPRARQLELYSVLD